MLRPPRPRTQLPRHGRHYAVRHTLSVVGLRGHLLECDRRASAELGTGRPRLLPVRAWDAAGGPLSLQGPSRASHVQNSASAPPRGYRNPDNDTRPWCFIWKGDQLSWNYCRLAPCQAAARHGHFPLPSPSAVQKPESTTQTPLPSLTSGSWEGSSGEGVGRATFQPIDRGSPGPQPGLLPQAGARRPNSRLLWPAQALGAVDSGSANGCPRGTASSEDWWRSPGRTPTSPRCTGANISAPAASSPPVGC